uniref:Reverse transcriptase Ty1/copia-type domain-containing protein n=1 Tax=Fagus sylvatica TaxID=28930 RepID=A0A2N9HCD2_FAGSY
MTLIFTDPSIDLYPDNVRDSASPSSSLEVSSLVLSPAAGLPDSDPTSISTIRVSHRYTTNPLWQQAMADELDALHKTHTWDMTTLPSGKSAVGCKWVYKIKTRTDGSVERYKARLVARVFTQEYGIDYEETFAPVALLTSVRSLLAVAAPPPGYPDSQNQVCRLRRALYGLKQAPRAWFAKISNVVAQQGFTSSSYDSTLFIRHTFTGITFILLYVDDMIITGDDTTGICDLQKFLSQHFEMKDLDTLSYFLGLEAGLTDSKTDSTPLELNVKLNTIDSEPLFDATLYQQLVGSLIYLTVTRPYLAYAVHLVSQFMSAPRSTHYAAVLRILQYIKGTLFHGLHFSAHSSLELCAYADVDWVGDPTDRRSTTGYCFLLGSSLISWRIKKQSVVARSSTEAEYCTLADATSEFLWLRWLLADMGAPQTTSTPIHCDNRSAIHIAHNDVFHERTKHIEIDYHFIRHHLQQSALHLLSISSKDQLADVFTKSNPPGRLRDLVSKLKMASLSPPCV